jgi:hypothetical protein
VNILRVHDAAVCIAELEGRHVDMSFLLAIKWSLVAFAVALVLSFLSMGFLGAVLYYACYPVLAPFFGNPNTDWSGDWVWSALVAAGMLWSFSFLAAGWLNFNLTPDVPAVLRGIVYVVVLWLSAALIWAFILVTSYESAAPKEARQPAEMVECGDARRSYVEAGLSSVFGAMPRLLDGPRCHKTDSSSDVLAMVELEPGFSPEGMEFYPGNDRAAPAPEWMEAMYPETFKGIAQSEFEVARFDTQKKFDPQKTYVAIYQIRLTNGKLYVLVNDIM